MEKPPILNNFKEKLKLNNSSPANDEDEDFADGQSDVLEQFNIPLTIDIPENVMTPNEASSVKFAYSQPKGFAIRQVEKFYGDVLTSLKFYVKALEKRDKNIHKLATEVDKYKTDYQNAKFQLEMFQGLGKQALVDDSGNYVSESQISENERILLGKEEEIANLRNSLLLARKDKEIAERDLHAARSAAPLPVPASHAPANDLSNEEREELEAFRESQTALDEWEKQVGEEYENIQSQLEEALASQGGDAALKAQLRKTQETLKEAEDKVHSFQQALVNEESRTATLQEQLITAGETVSASAQEAYTQIAIEADTLREELSAKEKELEEAIETANEIEDARALLEKELEEAKSAQPETVVDQSEIDSLNEHVASLDVHIDTLEKHIVSLGKDLGDKDSLLAEMKELIQEKESFIADLEASGSLRPQVAGYRQLPDGVRPEDLLGE